MRKKSSDNPDAMLGYSRQSYRALYYLLSKKADVLLEKDEDVSVLYGELFLVLEQIKDKGSKISAISNDFLNTLIGWAEKHRDYPKNFCFKTCCRLYHSFNMGIDPLIQSASDAKDDESAEEVYNRLITKIKASKKKNKQDILEHFNTLKTDIIAIIKIFDFEQSLGDPGLEQETHLYVQDLIKKNAPNEDSKYMADSIIGWFLQQTSQDEKKKKHKIKVCFDDFFEKYSAEISSSDEILHFPAPKNPPKNETEQYYVKQLNLINSDNNEINDAMVKYISWSKLVEDNLSKGKITQKKLNLAYDEFYREWNGIQKEIFIIHQNFSDETIGKLIYLKSLCINFRIQGVAIQDGNDREISRGVCSRLSNKDEPLYEIGWHPHYKDLIK